MLVFRESPGQPCVVFLQRVFYVLFFFGRFSGILLSAIYYFLFPSLCRRLTLGGSVPKSFLLPRTPNSASCARWARALVASGTDRGATACGTSPYLSPVTERGRRCLVVVGLPPLSARSLLRSFFPLCLPVLQRHGSTDFPSKIWDSAYGEPQNHLLLPLSSIPLHGPPLFRPYCKQTCRPPTSKRGTETGIQKLLLLAKLSYFSEPLKQYEIFLPWKKELQQGGRKHNTTSHDQAPAFLRRRFPSTKSIDLCIYRYVIVGRFLIRIRLLPHRHRHDVHVRAVPAGDAFFGWPEDLWHGHP